jgi:hypothetical protein
VQAWRSRLLSFEAQLDSLVAKLFGLDQPILLWLLALCQAATVLVTWPLWQVHRSPPMLPALPLPEINTGIILLITLAGIFFRPMAGLAIHTAAVVYSILIDQTRLQPEIVSLLILMWGSLSFNSLKTLARAHLISLWFYVGLNKLLSPGYRSNLAFLHHPRSSSRALMVPVVEILVGVLVCIPRTRKITALLAVALHLAIVATLVRGNWNSSVWAWNVGLAFAAIAFFYSWTDSVARAFRDSNTWAIAGALLILISPLGFYFGLGDPYLAHNLYTKNTPVAVWHRTDGTAETLQTWQAFNVPLPPEHRLFEQYFNELCGPRDYLVIQDPRYWAALRGYSERVVPCGR